MKLQLHGKRFCGQFIKEIGPTLTLVTPDPDYAQRFKDREAALRAWPGDRREVAVVK